MRRTRKPTRRRARATPRAAAARRILADLATALADAQGVSVQSSLDGAGATRIDRVTFHYPRPAPDASAAARKAWDTRRARARRRT